MQYLNNLNLFIFRLEFEDSKESAMASISGLEIFIWKTKRLNSKLEWKSSSWNKGNSIDGHVESSIFKIGPQGLAV